MKKWLRRMRGVKGLIVLVLGIFVVSGLVAGLVTILPRSPQAPTSVPPGSWSNTGKTSSSNAPRKSPRPSSTTTPTIL